MAFEGFSEAGQSFLTELGAQDKTWFDANKKTYQNEVVTPAKAFVVEIGEELDTRFGGSIVAQPKTNGSIAPINNDLRFSPDAAPYKNHLMFRFWEGPTKKTAPTLMIRMSPSDGIGFATGLAIADLARWRDVVADESTGGAGAKAIEALVADTDAEVVGEGLKRVPAPFDPDHPRADLLRHKGLQVRWVRPTPPSIATPAFVDWCAAEIERAADLHHWLVEHFT